MAGILAVIDSEGDDQSRSDYRTISVRAQPAGMMKKLKVLHQSNLLVDRDLVVGFHHELTAEAEPSLRLGRKPHPSGGQSQGVLASALQRSLQDPIEEFRKFPAF